MQQALEELRQSPVMERAIKLGAAAPRFALRNTAGKRVSLDDVLQKGPVVLTFYRGRW
jgi:peroxiredoxin